MASRHSVAEIAVIAEAVAIKPEAGVCGVAVAG